LLSKPHEYWRWLDHTTTYSEFKKETWVGESVAIVQSQVNLAADPLTGMISGSVYGNDQISCGGTQSTEWLVTEYKSSNQVSGTPQYYCLTSGETFNPALTQPCTVIPPPPRSNPTSIK
jgi:hypothetical protein